MNSRAKRGQNIVAKNTGLQENSPSKLTLKKTRLLSVFNTKVFEMRQGVWLFSYENWIENFNLGT
jgi:hypothetical protein